MLNLEAIRNDYQANDGFHGAVTYARDRNGNRRELTVTEHIENLAPRRGAYAWSAPKP
jgi:hypothetical protein